MCKKLDASRLLVDFSKVFYSIHIGMVEQEQKVYDLSKETVTAIMNEFIAPHICNNMSVI